MIRKELEQIFCQFDSKLEAADEVSPSSACDRLLSPVPVQSLEAVAVQTESDCATACSVTWCRKDFRVAHTCVTEAFVLVPGLGCPCLSQG